MKKILHSSNLNQDAKSKQISLNDEQIENKVSKNQSDKTQYPTYTTILVKKQILLKTFIKKLYLVILIITLFYALLLSIFNFVHLSYFEQRIEQKYSLASKNPTTKFLFLTSSVYSAFQNGTLIIIQTIIFIVISFVVQFLFLLFDCWIYYFNKTIESENPLVSQYGILIKGKSDFIKRDEKQIKDFIENFCQITIKQKIKQLKSYKHQINSSMQKQLIGLIHISNNHNLIQKIIFFSNYCQNFIKQNRKMPSKYILILFTYKYVPSTILAFWKNEQDLRKSIRSDVEKIIETPDPNQIIWQKLNNEQQSVKRVKSNLLLFILIETLYICVIILLTVLVIEPTLFTNHEIIINSKQTVVIITTKIYSLVLIIQQFLLKSIISKITYLKSDLNLIKFKFDRNSFTFWMTMINIIYLPIGLFLICGGSIKAYQNFYTSIIYSDIDLISIFSFYFAIKCIILPIITLFIRYSYQKNCIKKQKVLFQYQRRHIFDQFSQQITLFVVTVFYSILITPFFQIIYCIGAFIKLYGLLKLGIQNILSDNFSIKTFWKFLLIQINKIKNFFLIKCFFIANTIIIFLAVKNQIIGTYLLIISICFFIIFIIVDSIFIKYGLFWSPENRHQLFYRVFVKKLRILFPKLHIQQFSRLKNCYNLKNKDLNTQDNRKQLVQKYIKEIKNGKGQDIFQQNYQDSQFMQIEQVQKRCYKKQKFQITYEQMIQNNQNQVIQLGNTNLNHAFLKSEGEKNQVIEQLNTMSRSLQATLKERLFQKPPDPLVLLTKNQSQQDEAEYEQKVFMPQSKQKMKIPPLLNLNKITKDKETRINSLKIPKKQIKKGPKVSDSDISYELASNQNNLKKKQQKFKYQTKRQQKIKEQKKMPLLKKKKTPTKQNMKLVTLFDCQQESVKQIAHKKIKSSIQKIQY